MTSKAARHIELRENSVREWVQNKTIDIEHVSGKINPADIFTKWHAFPSLARLLYVPSFGFCQELHP